MTSTLSRPSPTRLPPAQFHGGANNVLTYDALCHPPSDGIGSDGQIGRWTLNVRAHGRSEPSAMTMQKIDNAARTCTLDININHDVRAVREDLIAQSSVIEITPIG